jgi:hypothetical protein
MPILYLMSETVEIKFIECRPENDEEKSANIEVEIAENLLLKCEKMEKKTEDEKKTRKEKKNNLFEKMKIVNKISEANTIRKTLKNGKKSIFYILYNFIICLLNIVSILSEGTELGGGIGLALFMKFSWNIVLYM